MNLGEELNAKKELQDLQIKFSILKASHLRELSYLQTQMEEDARFAARHHENAIEKLKDSHKHEIDCLEHKVSKLTNDVLMLQGCLHKHSRANFELNQKLAVEVEYRGGKNDKERKRLDDRLEITDALLKKKETELAELRAALERVQGDLRRKDDEIRQSQTQAQQKDLEIARLKAKTQELEGKCAKIDDNATELEFVQARLRVLEVENERLLQDLQIGDMRVNRTSRHAWPQGMMSVGASGASFMQYDQERLRDENDQLRVPAS